MPARKVPPIVRTAKNMPAIRCPYPLSTRAQYTTMTYPLPNLNATTHDLHAILLRIKVLNRPWLHQGKGLTWTVDEEPASRIQVGTLVILYTEAEESGIGRVSSVTDLRQHWVTFTLAGAEDPTHLRVPVVWAKLEDLAAYTFTNYFHALPPYPEAPAAARSRAYASADRVQPVTPRAMPEQPEGAEVRILRITMGSRHGRD